MTYIIKERPEDFIVQEITSGNEILNKDSYPFEKSEGNQLYCVLKKKNWDTLLAVREISRRLRISQQRIGYAGMKDKQAVTSQLISIYNIKKEDVENLKIRDIEIFPLKYSNKRIELGDLKGNHFIIIVKSDKKPHKALKVPNYYGEQRFGTLRRNSDIIGKALIDENFKNAVMLYLTETSEKEDSESTKAREKLAKDKNFKTAYKEFPIKLRFERMMLSKLAEKEDYIYALKALPKKLLMMFIHAYQSKLFNEYLSAVIERKLEYTEGPIFGYKYEVTNDLEKEILEKNKIWTDNFLVREFPELSMKGMKRNLYVDVEDLKIEKIDTTYKAEFSLPKACYATTVIDYLFKEKSD